MKKAVPPRSLDCEMIGSRSVTADGNESGASTPSEDYKTPSMENMPLPGSVGAVSPPSGIVVFPSPRTAEQFGYRMQHGILKSGGVLRSGQEESVVDGCQPVDRPPPAYRFGSIPGNGNKKEAYDSGVGSDEQIASSLPNGRSRLLQYAGGTSRENATVQLQQQQQQRVAKKTAFAALPNQTCWALETNQKTMLEDATDGGGGVGANPLEPLPSELLDIRLKLEERRRMIESEKRRIEMQWSRQRQQVGKEAFIQVVTKRPSASTSQPEVNVSDRPKPDFHRELSDGAVDRQRIAAERLSHEPQSIDFQRSALSPKHTPKLMQSTPEKSTIHEPQSNQQFRTKDGDGRRSSASDFRSARENLTQHSQEQLDAQPLQVARSGPVVTGESAARKSQQLQKTDGYSGIVGTTPEADRRASIGEYGNSLDRLNSSLTELQGEIMRLSLQQDQIKSLVNSEKTTSGQPSSRGNVVPGREQFFLFPRGKIAAESDIHGNLSSAGMAGISPSPAASTVYNSMQPMSHSPAYRHPPPGAMSVQPPNYMPPSGGHYQQYYNPPLADASYPPSVPYGVAQPLMYDRERAAYQSPSPMSSYSSRFPSMTTGRYQFSPAGQSYLDHRGLAAADGVSTATSRNLQALFSSSLPMSNSSDRSIDGLRSPQRTQSYRVPRTSESSAAASSPVLPHSNPSLSDSIFSPADTKFDRSSMSVTSPHTPALSLFQFPASEQSSISPQSPRQDSLLSSSSASKQPTPEKTGPPPASEAFFMVFDSDPPRRPKPVLGVRDRKDPNGNETPGKSNKKATNGSSVSPKSNVSEASFVVDTDTKNIPASTSPRTEAANGEIAMLIGATLDLSAPSAVGFVVGEDEPSIPAVSH